MKKIILMLLCFVSIFCLSLSSLSNINASQADDLYDIATQLTYPIISINGSSYYDGNDQFYSKAGSFNLLASPHQNAENVEIITFYSKINKYTVYYDDFSLESYANLKTIILRDFDASKYNSVLATLNHEVDVVVTGRCNFTDLSNLEINNLIIANGFTYNDFETDLTNLVTMVSQSNIKGIKYLDYMESYSNMITSKLFTNINAETLNVTKITNFDLNVTNRSINYCDDKTINNYKHIGIDMHYHFNTIPSTFAMTSAYAIIDNVDERVSSISMSLPLAQAPTINHKLDTIYIKGNGVTDMSHVTADTLIINNITEDSTIKLPTGCTSLIIEGQNSTVSNISILLANDQQIDETVNIYTNTSSYFPQYVDRIITTLPKYSDNAALTINDQIYELSSSYIYNMETFMYSLEQYLDYGYIVTESRSTIDTQFTQFKIRQFDDLDDYSIKEYNLLKINPKDDIKAIITLIKPYLLSKDGNSSSDDYELIIGDIYTLNDVTYIPCVGLFPNETNQKFEFIVEYDETLKDVAILCNGDSNFFIYNKAKADSFNEMLNMQYGQDVMIYRSDLDINQVNYIDNLEINIAGAVKQVKLVTAENIFSDYIETPVTPDDNSNSNNQENNDNQQGTSDDETKVPEEDLNKEPEENKPQDDKLQEDIYDDFITKLKDNNILKTTGLIFGSILGIYIFILIFKGFKSIIKIFKK